MSCLIVCLASTPGILREQAEPRLRAALGPAQHAIARLDAVFHTAIEEQSVLTTCELRAIARDGRRLHVEWSGDAWSDALSGAVSRLRRHLPDPSTPPPTGRLARRLVTAA